MSVLTQMNQTVLRCLEPALTLDGRTSAKEQKKRTLFLFIWTVVGMFVGVYIMLSWEGQGSHRMSLSAALVTLFVSVVGALCILLKCELRQWHIMVTICGLGLSIFAWDLHNRARLAPAWPMLVLCVDFLLVLELPARYSMGLVVFTCLWLIVLAAEETLRFGLLDLPLTIPQEGEYGRKEFFRKITECAVLPCAVPFPPPGMMVSLSVFVIDFFVTRSFAMQVLQEQASMERTIHTVQEIASLLAGYDVEQVAELLKAHEGDLPEGMTEALRNLEENLRKYRPYLPAALFESDVDEDGVQQPTVAPPGLVSETATIVFTDIRASTSIWEIAPEGMRAGLQIHNAVMREVMRMCGGYEVKTIGDAFMIAFASTCDGVAFGLRVQERLFEADWPASLLEDAPICSRQGSLWGGLTVRIGVNTGPVTVEQNTLTGRTDYFGHTVNVASRLESTCTPGAVALPSDLWTSVSGSCSAVVGAQEAVHLKGVSGSTLVCCVWPVSLGGRKETPLCESSPPSRRVSSAKIDKSQNLFQTMKSRCSSLASEGSSHSRLTYSTRQVSGTVGVAQLAVGDVVHNTAFPHMSSGLTTLTIALEQSGGSLVTLLGNCVCVGWNVSRSAPAHMENAIRFVQRMSVKCALNGAGLASGPVQHGDVGARSQRFVTVMGDVVRRSWALCEEAVRDGVVCLYEPPEETTLPSALEDVLVRHKGCYRVLEAQDDRARECDNVL